MSGPFDDAAVPIKCGSCGKQHNKTLAWLSSNTQLRCTCGTITKLDTSQLRREKAKIDGAWKGVEDALKKWK